MSLYIHWPYCEAKCPYCDFNSHVNEPIDSKNWIQSYTNQLHEMKKQLLEHRVNFNKLCAIFFGGGTPSLMPLEIIESILNTSADLFGFEENIEISLEANPSSYEKDKFYDLKNIGINRLSIGVQSLNDKDLKFLGRLHNSMNAKVAVEHAAKTFNNVSVDLIYALHGQKILEWTNELEEFLENNDLQHLSLYQLTIEKGTKFFTDYKKGLLNVIDNDQAADFYKVSNEILKNHNFFKYEVSNYAKKGFECNHNLNYWKSENWIGIGPGAYGRIWSSKSNIKRVEYQNYKNPKTWLSKNFNKSQFEKTNFFDSTTSDIDTLTMGLRLYEGIETFKLHDKSIIENDAFKELQNRNVIKIKNGFLKVNKKYMIRLNSIINFLINP
ncbi:MAG: radical SAM family heme chaperone HemW [Candidatus Puniceispirillales bacterium]